MATQFSAASIHGALACIGLQVPGMRRYSFAPRRPDQQCEGTSPADGCLSFNTTTWSSVMAKFPMSLNLLGSGLLALGLTASDVTAQGSFANPKGGAAPSAPSAPSGPSVGRSAPPSGAMPSGRTGTWSGPREQSGPRAYGYRDGGAHRRAHRHRGRVRIYGDYGYYPSYGYYGSCEYYRRRAISTGSRYWWQRYRECRRGG
jgi:hypothetical protein